MTRFRIAADHGGTHRLSQGIQSRRDRGLPAGLMKDHLCLRTEERPHDDQPAIMLRAAAPALSAWYAAHTDGCFDDLSII